MKKLLLSIILFFYYANSFASSFIITEPFIEAKGYVLFDLNSNTILAQKNIHQKIEPASLAKLMTTYITFKELKSGKLKLEDTALVSNKAWKMEGSRMFLKVNTEVSIENLIKGIIVQSGNDASVVIAEKIAGNEDNFAKIMNNEVKLLRMKDTYYTNSTGLPDVNLYTTIYDLLILSKNLLSRFPEYYYYFGIKDFVYNKIKQHNRNLLLFRDKEVDGIKTGHTSSAGFNLIASKKVNDRRLISIVIGAPNDKLRIQDTKKLLDWGFDNFINKKAYVANQQLDKIRVYKAKDKNVVIGPLRDIYVTIPINKLDNISFQINAPPFLVGEINKNTKVADLEMLIDNKVVKKYPLFTLQKVITGNIFRRIIDSIILFFKKK